MGAELAYSNPAGSSLGEQQMERYAQDVQQLYHEGRRLRREADVWNNRLERALGGMTTINNSLRDRLGRFFSLVYAVRDLEGGLKLLAAQTATFLSGDPTELRNELKSLEQEMKALEIRAKHYLVDAQLNIRQTGETGGTPDLAM